MHAKLRTTEELFAWLFRFFGVGCIFVALVFRVNLGPPLDAAFFAGVALFMLAPLFRRPSMLRDVTLEPAPGRLVIKKPGPFGVGDEDAILVRELTGASVARLADSVLVALARGSKANPLVLELASEDDAKSVCDALGIGRNGFGTLVWNRGPRTAHRLAALLRIADAVMCIAVAVAVFASDPFAATLDAQSTVTKIAIALAAFACMTPWVIAKRTIALLPHGVHIFEDRPRTIAYRDIANVRVTQNAIFLDVSRRKSDRVDPEIVTMTIPFRSPSGAFDGLRHREAEIIATQIRSASERARQAMDLPPDSSHVRALVQRRPNEAPLDWVTRLDSMADTWRTSPPRHGEAVESRHALWRVVEDHDGDDIVRALAARVLSRLDPDVAPPKIRVIAEASRDAARAERLQAALEPDAEPFVRALEAKGNAK